MRKGGRGGNRPLRLWRALTLTAYGANFLRRPLASPARHFPPKATNITLVSLAIT